MSVRIYECVGCGSRVMAQGYPGRCRDCGANLLNLTVRRE
ncbi:rubrerythrin-like domain-containing protein [Haloglomus salinum]|nr:rubrerythrin-like domain-containing protein [Haloglomus salinum]